MNFDPDTGERIEKVIQRPDRSEVLLLRLVGALSPLVALWFAIAQKLEFGSMLILVAEGVVVLAFFWGLL